MTVSVERVVENMAVPGSSAQMIITSNDNAREVIEQNKVVADYNIIGESSPGLSREFDTVIAEGDVVALNGDASASVHVDAHCRLVAPALGEVSSISWVEGGVDVVDGVADNDTVPRTIETGGGADTLVANRINTDVVAVVAGIARDREVGHVAIDANGFAGSEAQVIELVAVNVDTFQGSGNGGIGGGGRVVADLKALHRDGVLAADGYRSGEAG